MNIRLGVFVAASIVGICLGVSAAFSGHFWGAASFVVAGVACGITFACFEEVSANPSFWPLTVLAGAATIFSVYDVFLSSPATDMKEQAAAIDLVSLLLPLDMDSQGLHLSTAERTLIHRGVVVCSMQQNTDVLDLTVNAQKAISYGPTATLIDGVDSALAQKKDIRCLDYYRELRKTQAGLFVFFEKQHPWVVRQ